MILIRTAVISDIHGNYTALKYVLKDAEKQGVDNFICLGDLVLKGPAPELVLSLLKDIEMLAIIKGNTEDWFAINDRVQYKRKYDYCKYCRQYISNEYIRSLQTLPQYRVIKIRNFKFLLVHIYEFVGHNFNRNITIEPDKMDVDIILSGHTHKVNTSKIGDKIIVNAGSVGASYDGDIRASYIIMNFKDDKLIIKIRRVKYPIQESISCARRRELPFFNKYKYILENGINSGD
ncbi:MAG: metallophosphoesterase family protein [Halanaerobiaceae bacterium]